MSGYALELSFVFIYLNLMRNHPFSTLPVAISQQNKMKDNKHHEFPCVYYGFRYAFSTRKIIQPISVKKVV